MDKVAAILSRDNAKEWPDKVGSILRHFYKQSDKNLRITVEEDAETRRVKQNRLNWLWCGELAKHVFKTQGGVFSSEDIHEFVARKLLPVRVVNINGEQVTVRSETKTLSVKDFADYLNKFEYFAREHLGATLTNPDDLYWDALMKSAEQPQATEGM